MVCDACDTNDGHTGRREFLTETGPELRQVALASLELQLAHMESELLAFQSALACGSYKLLELAEAYAPEKGLVEAP